MDALFLILSLVTLSGVSYLIGRDAAIFRVNTRLTDRRTYWLRYLGNDKESIARHAINETTKPIDL